MAKPFDFVLKTKIGIGEGSVISQGSHLSAGTLDYNPPGFPLVAAPIQIRDQLWLSAEVFVHPGLVIEKRCVVGARAVVTKDMPEWMVCAGHPCRPIKASFY